MLMPVAIKMFIMITLCCDFFITETHDTVFLIEWKNVLIQKIMIVYKWNIVFLKDLNYRIVVAKGTIRNIIFIG